MGSQDSNIINEFRNDQHRFDVLEFIASGGAGSVLKVQDKKSKAIFAIKILHQNLLKDKTKLKRFKIEFEALKAMQHENIVPAFEYSVTKSGNHFIVMEYLSGDNLLHKIEAKRRLSLNFVLYIGTKMLQALEFSHSKQFIHRDIKPSNILFAESELIVKLVDFGIAKDLEGENITKIGSVLGTYGYMALENLQGKKAHPTMDIYSLGVLMFVAITGKLPFPRGRSFFYKIVNEEIPYSLLSRANCDEEVIELIKNMTHKDWKKRVQSCAEALSLMIPLSKEFPFEPDGNDDLLSKINDTIQIPESEIISSKENRTLRIKQFRISTFPITHYQYNQFISETGYQPPEHWQIIEVPYFFGLFKSKKYSYPKSLTWHPIFNINFFDAKAYASWAGGRLPTPDEWEIAAGGIEAKMFLYPWGNEFDNEKLNCSEEYALPGEFSTSPVNFFHNGRSPFGCYDMVGNLSEWCNNGDKAFLKGGNFRLRDPEDFYISKTHEHAKKSAETTIGLRLVFEG
ncbi:bifunctional serine/threonine-protein kinase/formylglycine-generating enzyme family protein [Candidatus Riflebacteria bacterium]